MSQLSQEYKSRLIQVAFAIALIVIPKRSGVVEPVAQRRWFRWNLSLLEALPSLLEVVTVEGLWVIKADLTARPRRETEAAAWRLGFTTERRALGISEGIMGKYRESGSWCIRDSEIVLYH